MKNPRICLVAAGFYPSIGGVQTQALLHGRSLQAHGYEVRVLTLRHDRAWPRQEQVEGVPVTRVAGLLLHKRERLPRLFQRLWYLLALLVLAWQLWLQRKAYDLLFVYRLNLLALPVALIAVLTHKRLIVSVGCSDAHAGTRSGQATLAAGSLDPATPWLVLEEAERDDGDLESLERAGKPFVRLLHALLLRSSALVVTLSSRMQADLLAHDFQLPRLFCLPNGVDIQRFTPLAMDPQEARPQVVVSVSRLCYQKGIDVLLQAWKLVTEQLTEPALLVIVGDGPLRPQLILLTQALGLEERVEFAGARRDIAAQWQRGTVGVLASRWEGMPNTLLEAMACGLPCVATRVSGCEDIIQSGENGLLVEADDYTDLAQALLTLLQKPEQARRYAQAARQTVETRYTQEHLFAVQLALYHELLQSDAPVPVPSLEHS